MSHEPGRHNPPPPTEPGQPGPSCIGDDGLRRIASQLPGVIYQFLLRPDGSYAIPFASEAIERIFDISAEELLHDPEGALERIHPEDLDRLWAATYESAAKLTECVIEFRTLDGHGAWRWIRCNATPQRLPDGSTLWHGFLSDVTDEKRTDEQLRLMAMIADRTDNAVIVTDAERRIVWVNESFTRLSQYTLEEVKGRPPGAVLQGEATDPGTRARIREQLDRGETVRTELLNYRKDGSAYWCELAIQAVRDDTGRITHYIGLQSDVTERHESQRKLRESEQRYALAVRGSTDGLWDWDLQTDRVYFSPRWKQMLGYAEDQIGEDPDEWFRRIASRDLPDFQSALDRHIQGETEHLEVELEMQHADGSPRWMLCRAAAVRNEQGRAVRIAGSLADLTRIRRAERELRVAAETDQLTGLANRRQIKRHIDRLLAQLAESPDRTAALFFVDLDRFKVVNDSLGHDAGDRLLQSMAERLRRQLRPDDTIGRFGGDEFVILLSRVGDAGNATRIAHRLLRACEQPIELDGRSLSLTASIGVVGDLAAYAGADEALRDADAAMYQAKHAGKNRFHLFDHRMHDAALERLDLEADLKHADFDAQFRLCFQPLVQLEDGRLDALEALVRWEHPRRGMVPPDRFIPMAEETGLIVPLGAWVLRTACRRLRELRDRGLAREVRINVNVSRRQLIDPALIQTVRDALAEHRLDPADLELEVTESAIMTQPDQLSPTLEALREMGVELALDDFGTGHSSLSCLHGFPLQTLKIDRSFVWNMRDEPEYTAVVGAIIALADHLGLDVVAEGIETREQIATLIELGCRLGQGFYFARPLAFEQLETWLRNGARPSCAA